MAAFQGQAQRGIGHRMKFSDFQRHKPVYHFDWIIKRPSIQIRFGFSGKLAKGVFIFIGWSWVAQWPKWQDDEARSCALVIRLPLICKIKSERYRDVWCTKFSFDSKSACFYYINLDIWTSKSCRVSQNWRVFEDMYIFVNWCSKNLTKRLNLIWFYWNVLLL